MNEETAELINKNVTSKIRESRFNYNAIQILNGYRVRLTYKNIDV